MATTTNTKTTKTAKATQAVKAVRKVKAAVPAQAAFVKPMTREDVTDLIYAAKVSKGIKWSDVADQLMLSKEWTTAACLGQMTLTRPQAERVGKIFGLPAQAVALLQVVPYKGSLPTAVPTDPLIYRWYEIVNVYGSRLRAIAPEARIVACGQKRSNDMIVLFQNIWNSYIFECPNLCFTPFKILYWDSATPGCCTEKNFNNSL